MVGKYGPDITTGEGVQHLYIWRGSGGKGSPKGGGQLAVGKNFVMMIKFMPFLK